MKLKLDLHVHSKRSHDAFTDPSDLDTISKAQGLDGVAITDHNTVVERLPDGLITVPGIEVSSIQGHVIGLGISSVIPRGLSADQTIDEIHSLGGVAIIPHPYDFFRPSVRPETLRAIPDAIEVANSASFFHRITWKKARTFAESNHLPAVGGSDSHIPRTVGKAYTLVDADSTDVGSILQAIKRGSVSAVEGSISFTERLRKWRLSASRR